MARVPTEVFHSHPNLLDCIERGENPVGRVFVDGRIPYWSQVDLVLKYNSDKKEVTFVSFYRKQGEEQYKIIWNQPSPMLRGEDRWVYWMTDNMEILDRNLPGVLRQLVNGVRRKYSLSQTSPSCTETASPRSANPGNNIDSYEEGYAGRLA